MIRAAVLALAMAGPAFGAAGTDPDWPCIQRQQPNLSLGQVWSGPEPDEAAESLSRERAIANLAERIEQRRMPMDEAEAEIAAFAAEAEPAQLVALMRQAPSCRGRTASSPPHRQSPRRGRPAGRGRDAGSPGRRPARSRP